MMMMISQTDITRKRCLIEEYQEIIGKTQNALSLKLFSPYYKTRKNYELIITKFSDPLMSIIFTSTDFLYIQFFRVNLKIPCPFTWCSKCLFHNFLRKYCLHLQDDWLWFRITSAPISTIFSYSNNEPQNASKMLEKTLIHGVKTQIKISFEQHHCRNLKTHVKYTYIY